MAHVIYGALKFCRDYGFVDQIKRASVSVSNNIAEGFERQTNKELIYFLYVAKGSCGEVRSMIYLAKRLGYIKDEDFDQIVETTKIISKMLGGFIKPCR